MDYRGAQAATVPVFRQNPSVAENGVGRPTSVFRTWKSVHRDGIRMKSEDETSEVASAL